MTSGIFIAQLFLKLHKETFRSTLRILLRFLGFLLMSIKLLWKERIWWLFFSIMQLVCCKCTTWRNLECLWCRNCSTCSVVPRFQRVRFRTRHLQRNHRHHRSIRQCLSRTHHHRSSRSYNCNIRLGIRIWHGCTFRQVCNSSCCASCAALCHFSNYWRLLLSPCRYCQPGRALDTSTVVAINTAEPHVASATTGKLTHIRLFIGMDTHMNPHIGPLCKCLAALWARIQRAWLSNAHLHRWWIHRPSVEKTRGKISETKWGPTRRICVCLNVQMM